MSPEQQERLVTLLREHKASLERFVLNMTRNRDDAKELMSETIALVCESFTNLRDEQAFLSYVFSIAVRRWRTHRVRTSRMQNMSSEDIDALYSAEMSAETSFAISELRAAIDSLEPDYREVLVLSEIVGLAHKDIALALELSPTNVRVRVHRAKNMLRELLQDTHSSVSSTMPNQSKGTYDGH